MTGFVKEVIIEMKTGLVFNGVTALDIIDIPVIRTANPNMIVPKCTKVSRFANICNRIPTIATIAAIVVLEIKAAIPFPASI